MSKWRVEIDLAFNTEDEVISFVNLIEGIKDKLYLLDDAVIKTPTVCRYHECFHDENPSKPCGDYKFINFKAPLEIHLKNNGIEVNADLIVKNISDEVLTDGVVIK